MGFNMDELNRDPQQQDQGGGLVEMLSSLLSPQSAEAASAPNPQTQLFQALQFANHLKQQQQMQQQQAQTAQQRAIIVPLQQQLLQQRVVAGTEKAKPKPSIAELLGSPQQVGNSGASQVPMFRGITPNTGTPYFGNVMPDWSTPEAKAQFEQASQRLNPPSAAAEVKGKLTPEKTQLLGTLAEHLKSVPEAQRMIALRNLIPELDVQEKQVLQDKLGIKQIEVQQAKDIAKSTAVAPGSLSR